MPVNLYVYLMEQISDYLQMNIKQLVYVYITTMLFANTNNYSEKV